MSDIQRYDVCDVRLTTDRSGDWVKHEDAEKLEAKVQELEEANIELQFTLNNIKAFENKIKADAIEEMLKEVAKTHYNPVTEDYDEMLSLDEAWRYVAKLREGEDEH